MYLHFMATLKFYRHVIKPVEFPFFSIKINDKCQRVSSLQVHETPPAMANRNHRIIEIMTH